MASSLAFLVLVLSVPPPGLIDLNSATRDQLMEIAGLSGHQADVLLEYVFRTGGLEEVYEVMDLPGFGPVELARLREGFAVFPPGQGRIPPGVNDVMERLAAEDGPGDAAVDMWESLLVRPMPINASSAWDLRQLDRVSLIDAVAVERRLRESGPVSSVTSLRGIDDLTYYGYRNMRDFVSTRDLDLSSMQLFGNYRVILDAGCGRDAQETGLEGRLSDLDSALLDLESGSRDYTGSPVDSASLHESLTGQREELLAARWTTGWAHRVSIGLGDRLRAGARLSRGRLSTAGHELISGMDMGDLDESFDVAKACFSLHHLGPVRQAVLGNYRLTLGQGLMIDNTDEWWYRQLSRTWGLHSDLTSTRQFDLNGAAVELRYLPLVAYGFFSSTSRDALMNLDGTPNMLTLSEYRTSAMASMLDETTLGGYAFLDLGGVLPTGSAIGVGAMSVSWSDSLVPDAGFIDIPGDGYSWECPEYDALDAGDGLSVAAASGQTVLGPFSLEGELARQDNGAIAGLGCMRWQNNYFYLTGAFRHYDQGYTNPFCRGFAEQTRFDDTVFEKPYYLNDPLFSEAMAWPVPKPEEGLYLESRFQLSQHIVFPKVYLDVWRSLPYDFDNYRFQGEIEYRPVFPLRFRLKYKFQDKQKMHDVVPTTSRTQELTLRCFSLPEGRDFFDLSLRYGLVQLTPNPAYGDDRLMTGGYLTAKWEHRFTESFSLLGGTTLWTTSGMSQWEFEDTGIDFLDGHGTKFYVTLKNVLSDYLQLRLRVLRKDTFYPHNGLYRPDPDDQYYYEGDPGSPVRDFGDHVTSYGFRCQLDFRW
ncbi:hypothetical protein JW921_02720 [Candidatus Fermentibacterales bacterium]|nr:hypothetical protein [Candidatus Fermentibacterales bacterium]